MSKATITYHFEDAVRHAAAHAGLSEKDVWQVLDAKERYLDLTGLTNVEQDEVLLSEREAIRHLLPRIANVLDEGETRYIALRTQLDEATIQKVMAGDLDYMRMIGLVGGESVEAPAPAKLFRWHEVHIPYTPEKFGKLVYVSPKRRPAALPPEAWGAQLFQALLALREEGGFDYLTTWGASPWLLADSLTLRQRDRLPDGATWHTWWGWNQLVLTAPLEAPSRTDGVIRLRQTYSDRDKSEETPGRDLAGLFKTLKAGGTVLVFGTARQPSGFIPAVIATLADPSCHVAKVIYPIRQELAFSQLEIGYLAGLWDARERHCLNPDPAL